MHGNATTLRSPVITKENEEMDYLEVAFLLQGKKNPPGHSDFFSVK